MFKALKVSSCICGIHVTLHSEVTAEQTGVRKVSREEESGSLLDPVNHEGNAQANIIPGSHSRLKSAFFSFLCFFPLPHQLTPLFMTKNERKRSEDKPSPSHSGQKTEKVCKE